MSNTERPEPKTSDIANMLLMLSNVVDRQRRIEDKLKEILVRLGRIEEKVDDWETVDE